MFKVFENSAEQFYSVELCNFILSIVVLLLDGGPQRRDCMIHWMPIVAQMSEVLFFMLIIWKYIMPMGICIADKAYSFFTCQYSTLTYKPRSKCQFFTGCFLTFLFRLLSLTFETHNTFHGIDEWNLSRC